MGMATPDPRLIPGHRTVITLSIREMATTVAIRGFDAPTRRPMTRPAPPTTPAPDLTRVCGPLWRCSVLAMNVTTVNERDIHECRTSSVSPMGGAVYSSGSLGSFSRDFAKGLSADHRKIVIYVITEARR